ncbi:MAG TPA: hypothetical protein VLD19_04060, partial [Chitinophagaceae bacterium]|nr:hypothetical protein [Chitinophagaceae bacterium]
FILAMMVNTYVPAIGWYSLWLVKVAKAGLTVTLFLIGCGLSRKALQSVGWKPMLQGVLLWVLVSVAALCAVMVLA